MVTPAKYGVDSRVLRYDFNKFHFDLVENLRTEV